MLLRVLKLGTPQVYPVPVSPLFTFYSYYYLILIFVFVRIYHF